MATQIQECPTCKRLTLEYLMFLEAEAAALYLCAACETHVKISQQMCVPVDLSPSVLWAIEDIFMESAQEEVKHLARRNPKLREALDGYAKEKGK